MWAMIVKEFRQLRQDRRTLAMMIVLPILLLVVLGYAASFDVPTITVVAASRIRSCARTRAYVARRTAEGKTPREIRRCLKRYIARELYRQITRSMKPLTSP